MTQRAQLGADASQELTEPDPKIKFGLLAWPQYTGWAALHEVAARSDALGYDSLWTWDHLYPIYSATPGPVFEGYMTLAAWASITSRVQLGLMVTANTFRPAGVLAKMITTLDHISGGRAVLGIGAGWFEAEHQAFGVPFPVRVGDRLDRLEESARLLVRLMRAGDDGALDGPVLPPPRHRIPILIGGRGEKKTLRLVARYADIWNAAGTVEELVRKDAVLRDWCSRLGRDEAEIERSVLINRLSGGGPLIRDSVREARREAIRIARHNGGITPSPLAGPVDLVVEHLSGYVRAGYRNLCFDLPAPFDHETMERLMTEVRPRLEAL